MNDTPKPGTLAFEKARNAELVSQCDKLHAANVGLVAALKEIEQIGATELVHVHPEHGRAPHRVALIARAALEKSV